MNLFNETQKIIQGYVYASKEDGGLFENAKVGDLIIKKDKKPPYIVVDHSLDTKIITQWPGRLFKVEVVDPSNEKKINEGLVKDIWYTRTLGVKIIEEVPIGELFGAKGQWVKRIIDLTRNIEEQKVLELSRYDHNLNRDLYDKAWQNWILLYDNDHSFLKEEHYNTILLSPKNEGYGSPIKGGLSVISSQFSIRAREIAGDKAFGVDEEGDVYLQPTWSKAMEIILQAGMSYASDDILSEAERKALRTPFDEVFGLV